MSSTLLKNFCMTATREQLIQLFSGSEVSVEELRTCAFICLGGNPAELNGANGAATSAPAAPVAPKAPKAPKAAAAAAAPGTQPAFDGLAAIVKALADTGNGFAKGDLVLASGCTPAQASTALKNAMAAGIVKNAGDRRFSRYGATAAIATAASKAAHKGG